MSGGRISRTQMQKGDETGENVTVSRMVCLSIRDLRCTHCFCLNPSMTSYYCPIYPHATGVAMYLALFIKR